MMTVYDGLVSSMTWGRVLFGKQNRVTGVLRSSGKGNAVAPVVLMGARSFLLLTQDAVELGNEVEQLVWVRFFAGLFCEVLPVALGRGHSPLNA